MLIEQNECTTVSLHKRNSQNGLVYFWCLLYSHHVKKINKYTYLCDKHFPDGVNLDWRKNADLEPYPVNFEISINEDPLSEIYLPKIEKENTSNSSPMVRQFFRKNIFILGVKVRNMKMDFNTGGTLRRVGQ